MIYLNKSDFPFVHDLNRFLDLDHSLYEILRVLDLNMFETTPISALLGKLQSGPETDQDPIQQNLSPTLGH
jgi:hypothetical protein